VVQPENEAAGVALRKSAATISVLLLGGVDGESSDPRRPRQVGALPERAHWKIDVGICDEGARRIVAGGGGRSRVRRLERRAILRAERRDRREAVGVHCGCSAVGVAGDCGGADRDRLAGREIVLLWRVMSPSSFSTDLLTSTTALSNAA